ncbi:MAG: MFS transporter [Oleiphilaceae bacterium]|nr:MFS transporter [Oleiphilaceae bacterium]
MLAFLASFGQTFFISVFAGDIRQAFGLSHGQWGLIYTLGTAASATVMIWSGGLTDKFRVRVLGTATLGCLALACVAMAWAPSVGVLFLAIFALRLAGQGMTMQIALVAMSRWFIASRGKAISIANLGGNAGEAILPLLFAALMLHHEWRDLWLLAGVVVLIGIPALLWLLVKERTVQFWAQGEESVGIAARHWTRNQAFCHWLFWFMVPALVGLAAFNTAFFFHQVHFAAIKNWQHVELVSLFPGYIAAMVGATLVFGWIMDKTSAARLVPWIQLPMVVCFALLAYAETLVHASFALFFMALTTGANSVITTAFWAEVYGTRHLGSIKAMAAATIVFGSAIGPGISGFLIDQGLGLEAQFRVGAIFFLGTTVLVKIGVRRAIKC